MHGTVLLYRFFFSFAVNNESNSAIGAQCLTIDLFLKKKTASYGATSSFVPFFGHICSSTGVSKWSYPLQQSNVCACFSLYITAWGYVLHASTLLAVHVSPAADG